MSDLAHALVQLERDYVDPVPREKLLEGAIRGMVHELDPHSSYFTRDEYEAFLADTRGSFGGIGVEVEARRDEVLVVAALEGGPAARVGIRSGDRIVRVGGDDVPLGSFQALVRAMRGPPGSAVRVVVERSGVREPLVFDLKREIIRLRSVEGKRLGERVIYLRVRNFQESTYDEFARVLAELLREGGGAPRGVLLDVRGNPGGLVDQATAIADELLDSGTIYSARHRGRVVLEASATRGGALVAPYVVVLVDEASASAAELLAAALQDHGRALVVGTQTFGKGIIQSVFELPGGSAVSLTTARYYSPRGRPIQGAGITPDVWLRYSGGQPAVPRLRERDLPGAMVGERVERRSFRTVTVEGRAPTALDRIDVGRIPQDPRTGDDAALKVAYVELRGQMGLRP
jgi:carboxyl-terminal processing protease